MLRRRHPATRAFSMRPDGSAARTYLLAAALVALVSLFSAGCSKDPMARQSVSYGTVAGEGVVIEAEDGSFRLTSGQRFDPPFENDIWTARDFHPGPDLPSRWSAALARGAKRVRVTTPNAEQPLHGVLLLNTHVETAMGLGAFNYRIEIPDAYVDAARGGRVSVVHEDILWGNGTRGRSWLLWISDQPFGT